MIDIEGSMLFVGGYVTDHANDKLELKSAVTNVNPEVRRISIVCADTGYFSKPAVQGLEAEGAGPTVYCAIERQTYHRTVEDLERNPASKEPPETATIKDKMAYRLKTDEGLRYYEKRKETIEPAFGIIKSVLGFRQFLSRGLEKVSIELDLVMLVYNRLYRLGQVRYESVLT